MAASIVRLSLGGGILHFHCPVCGSALIEDQIGLSEELCAHVVGVIDWVQQLIIGPAVASELAEALEAAFNEDNADDVEAFAKVLPATVVVFDLAEPDRGGGHTGECIAIAVEFANAGENECAG
jgi:hypothetical protein